MEVEGEGQERDCSPKQDQSIKLKDMRKGVCVWGANPSVYISHFCNHCLLVS